MHVCLEVGNFVNKFPILDKQKFCKVENHRNIPDKMSKNILIGGGSGFIGTSLVNALKQSGHKTQIISRNAGQDRLSWGMISKKGLPNDCHAVINLAGANIANFMRRWPNYKKEVYDSRIKTTHMLADAIVKAEKKPSVFITASAVGYYPMSDETVYTEDSPIGGPDDYFTTLCKDWEAAGNLPNDVQTRRVIIRIALVMGRQGGVVKQTIVPFWLGLGGPMGSGRQWMPWVHIDDLVGIFQHALNNQSINGVLNAVAPEMCTNKEWARAYGKALKRPAIIPLPGFYMKALFGSERAKMFLGSQKVVPKRTLESGYRFKYPDIESAASEFAHLR